MAFESAVSSPAPANAGNEAAVSYRRNLQVFVYVLFFAFGGITSLNDVIIPKLKGLFTLTYGEVMLVQSAMLMVNSYRLHQMLQLVRDVKKSVNSDLSMEWLKPFMTERRCEAGEVLFYKDEKAEDMLYIVSGRFKLVESGIELPVGAIVGELGMLSPSNMRTQTLECIESGMILSVSYTKVEELYVQNPEFGFYFLRLASARLFQNIATLEQRLAQQTAYAAPKPA